MPLSHLAPNDILLHFYVVLSKYAGKILAPHDLPVLESVHFSAFLASSRLWVYYYEDKTIAI
jgi:hypothetical protein